MQAHSLKRLTLLTICCIFSATLLGGLQNTHAQTAPDAKKIVLIGNQKFGDKGPMDAMSAGLDKCAKDFGFQVHRLESPTPAQHEEDVRAMAKEGYGLIMTTFPAMTDATLTVAQEYPDTRFAAIYQFVNVGGKSVANVWDTDYQGQQATYLLGTVAGKLTKSKKLGYLQGDETEPIRNERNGFTYGVKSVCPDCTVEYGIRCVEQFRRSGER
jgi:basic membrane protein A and related proteins